MKGDNIAQRLLEFAAHVLKIVSRLPKTPEGRHIAKQLVRAATATGANYEEARGAESRADFVHKVKLALKEMRESYYWLRLIDHANLIHNLSAKTLIEEAHQLVAILTASAKTAQSR